MKVLILAALILSSCSDYTTTSSNVNSSEPTLQSAEDAMRKDFTEESFK